MPGYVAGQGGRKRTLHQKREEREKRERKTDFRAGRTCARTGGRTVRRVDEKSRKTMDANGAPLEGRHGGETRGKNKKRGWGTLDHMIPSSPTGRVQVRSNRMGGVRGWRALNKKN